MTRAELITELAASHPHLRQADVELIVTTVFDQIAQALTNGDRVELRGFGRSSSSSGTPGLGAIHGPAKRCG